MPNIADGELVRGADFPATVFSQDDTTLTGSASPTYIPGTPEVGVYFMAPTSGRVIVTVGGAARDTTAADARTFLSPEVFLGSALGTQILAPAVESYGWANPGSNSDYVFGSRSSLLDGLTPGRVYYARVMMSTEGTSAEIKMREIMVEPVS